MFDLNAIVTISDYHCSEMVEFSSRDQRHDDERPVGHGHPLGGGGYLGAGGVSGGGVVHLGDNVGGGVWGRRVFDGGGLGRRQRR